MKKIALIGGGPAGLYAAYILQQNNMACTVFDHRIPFEKACGGGITSKAFVAFPLLKGCEVQMQYIHSFRIISPGGNIADIDREAALHIISRKTLSDYMLQQATAKGAVHIAEKVTGCQKKEDGFTVQTEQQVYPGFDFVIGADGANGISRQLLQVEAFNKNRIAGIGYYIDGLTENKVTIKFYPDFQGYLWVFPRPGHASVGIGFPSGKSNKTAAQEKIKQFLETYYPGLHIDPEKSYAATIPFVPQWEKSNVQGEGWALIGDAGGFADALTGEGIYYAFKSAEVLARCLIKNHPEEYFDASIFIREELAKSYTLLPRFYKTRRLEALVYLCKKSAYIRQLSARLISGEQGYIGLKKELIKKAPLIIVQLLGSWLHRKA